MPDIDNVMGVDAGDIDSIMGVSSGDIDTFMGVTLVTSQGYEGQIFLMTGGYTVDPGYRGAVTNGIQKKSSTSTGDSSAFGDMQADGNSQHAAAGGGGRGIVAAAGNTVPAGADNADIYYVTIASDGDAADTSDNVTQTVEGAVGNGNGVKMGIGGGFDGDLSGDARYTTTMQRYTIAGGSGSSDIGDMQYPGGYDVYHGTTSIRWIMAGGYSPGSGDSSSLMEDIHYMTWASEGNSADLSNLTARRTHGNATVSSEAVMVFGSSTSAPIGGTTETRTHQMDWINPTTTTDAADFGDDVGDDGDDDTNSATRSHGGNVQDGTRGEFWDGDSI